MTPGHPCCCDGYTCEACDGLTPATFTVTIPNDFTPAGDCTQDNCDTGVGDFVVQFYADEIADSCTWTYTFDPADSCEWQSLTVVIHKIATTMYITVNLIAQTHVIRWRKTLTDLGGYAVDCTFGAGALTVDWLDEYGTPQNCSWGGSAVTVTPP